MPGRRILAAADQVGGAADQVGAAADQVGAAADPVGGRPTQRASHLCGTAASCFLVHPDGRRWQAGGLPYAFPTRATAASEAQAAAAGFVLTVEHANQALAGKRCQPWIVPASLPAPGLRAPPPPAH